MDFGAGYWPQISTGKPIAKFSLGEHFAVVLGDCESAGIIQYLYVMYVINMEDEQLRMCVAAETHGLPGMLIGGATDGPAAGPCFLGVFLGTGHMNMGSSPEWADLDRFTERALELVCEQLQIDAEVVEPIEE